MTSGAALSMVAAFHIRLCWSAHITQEMNNVLKAKPLIKTKHSTDKHNKKVLSHLSQVQIKSEVMNTKSKSRLLAELVKQASCPKFVT